MSAPTFPRRVSVAEVIDNARCELYTAVAAHNKPWVRRWAAAFEFSFVVDRDANVSTDTSYLVPIELGTFGIGLKANLKQKARGTYALKYKITKGLDQEKVFEAFGPGGELDCDQRLVETPRRLLNGEIGLQRWLNEVIPQIEKAHIMNEYKGEPTIREDERERTGELDALSYTIEFSITADGTLLPSWALTYPDKRQFKPGLGFTASEVVSHKLIVAMTPRAITTPEAPDWSTVLQTRLVKTRSGDKKVQVIVARKVCVVEGGKHEACDAEAHKDEVIQQKKQQLTELKKRLVTERSLRTLGDRSKSSEEAKLEFEVKELQADLQTLQADAQKRVVVESQRARTAVRRAEAEADRETDRKLDLLIQQQVIRDAFRQ